MPGSVKLAQVVGIDLFDDEGGSADFDGPLTNLVAPEGYAIKEVFWAGEVQALDPEHTYERYVAVQKNDNVAEIDTEIHFSCGGDKLPGSAVELLPIEFTMVFTQAGVATGTTNHLGGIAKF